MQNRQETPIARLGNLALAAVFAAVMIVFAARWFVALDYQRLSVGDRVDVSGNCPGLLGYGIVKEMDGRTITIRDTHSERTFKIDASRLKEI